MRLTYFTSYCNFYHDVRSGKPIDHKCNTLPPNALKAEMEGDYQKANDILYKWKSKNASLRFSHS